MLKFAMATLLTFSSTVFAHDKTNCDAQATKAINALYALNDGIGEVQVATADKPGLGKTLEYRDLRDGRFTARVLDGIDLCVVLSVTYNQQ